MHSDTEIYQKVVTDLLTGNPVRIREEGSYEEGQSACVSVVSPHVCPVVRAAGP